MTPKQREAIVKHGRNVQAIFPCEDYQDEIKLCKALRRIEAKAHAIGLQMCNGPEMSEDEIESRKTGIMLALASVLGQANHVPIFINLDPRGYALKIRDEWMRDHPGFVLERDWGGYGILAPEIGRNGE